jgi:hypothetical protein
MLRKIQRVMPIVDEGEERKLNSHFGHSYPLGYTNSFPSLSSGCPGFGLDVGGLSPGLDAVGDEGGGGPDGGAYVPGDVGAERADSPVPAA